MLEWWHYTHGLPPLYPTREAMPPDVEAGFVHLLMWEAQVEKSEAERAVCEARDAKVMADLYRRSFGEG